MRANRGTHEGHYGFMRGPIWVHMRRLLWVWNHEQYQPVKLIINLCQNWHIKYHLSFLKYQFQLSKEDNLYTCNLLK